VVEGPHDVQFLPRISAILHCSDAGVPNLADMERRLQLVFAPVGGSDSSSAFRFAGLNMPEFHLLDRDAAPATEARQRVAAMVNTRLKCRACITSKRSLENYLDSKAICEAGGIAIEVTDDANVPELVARAEHESRGNDVAWDQLPPRARKRLRDKAKRWLNAAAVDRMTAERMAARDPDGEVRSWLATIAELAGR
jgi:hypothetical protein